MLPSGSKFRPGRTASPARLSYWHLAVLACLSMGAWFLTERLVLGAYHPHYLEMLIAARTAGAAAQVIRSEKERLGLLQPITADPNRTGLIGPEWSEITTTLGSLPSKRTSTNPDLAAALVKELTSLPVAAGDTAVVAFSGSFVGGNLAVLAAVQALGLRPVVVSSLGASMWGATDPSFNWLEMEAALRASGLSEAESILAVFGGDSGSGSNILGDGKEALRSSANRFGVPILGEAESLGALVSEILARIQQAIGNDETPAVFINVGGATVSIGTCHESHVLPNGLVHEPLPCSNGVPGLISLFAEQQVPVLHLLDLRSLSVAYGLPYDPVPLPRPGDNPRVYGARLQ